LGTFGVKRREMIQHGGNIAGRFVSSRIESFHFGKQAGACGS
jgi:hypothetical protein